MRKVRGREEINNIWEPEKTISLTKKDLRGLLSGDRE